jgi:hypothetical protein
LSCPRRSRTPGRVVAGPVMARNIRHQSRPPYVGSMKAAFTICRVSSRRTSWQVPRCPAGRDPAGRVASPASFPIN